LKRLIVGDEVQVSPLSVNIVIKPLLIPVLNDVAEINGREPEDLFSILVNVGGHIDLRKCFDYEWFGPKSGNKETQEENMHEYSSH
jgi:hypothetical protein